jgi:hypothetical protein
MEGRYLGGRPPYGYLLIDLGPHPNPGKAATGQRLHGLDLDQKAAPVVARIFAEFVAGTGLYAIAEGLTRDGIPCPSAHDRRRNAHRSGVAWSKGAIRAILTNPRYSGHQVWNKQRKDEVLLDVEDVALGHETRMRWNDPQTWVRSATPSHPAIVTAETFQQAQDTIAASRRGDKPRMPRGTPRTYQLRSLLFCGLCTRRMQGNWNHGVAHYRCRYPNEYSLANHVQHPRTVYLREDQVIPSLDRWVSTIFRPDSIERTLDQLADSQPDPDAETLANRAALAECDKKLARRSRLGAPHRPRYRRRRHEGRCTAAGRRLR